MENLTLNDYALIALVAIIAAKKLMSLAGWDRGAMVADELQSALAEARSFILKAKAGDIPQIDRAAEVAASKLKGVDAEDVKPIITALVNAGQDARNGATFKIDGQGNIEVNPAGVAAKLARKSAKWLKKVF